MAAASRATGAHLCLALTPAERAAVAAELAGLSARVANLAAPAHGPGRAGPARRDNPECSDADHRGFRRTRQARRAGPGHHHEGQAMAVTREKLLADPQGGARPLDRHE